MLDSLIAVKFAAVDPRVIDPALVEVLIYLERLDGMEEVLPTSKDTERDDKPCDKWLDARVSRVGWLLEESMKSVEEMAAWVETVDRAEDEDDEPGLTTIWALEEPELLRMEVTTVSEVDAFGPATVVKADETVDRTDTVVELADSIDVVEADEGNGRLGTLEVTTLEV
ncbi:hypothetical protein H2203_006378 [Taxawa tesnikishii (nom. ined.)]|nr:hypothetical protein H2203_006378 [Dothideales sp. JES 119]